MKFEVDVPNWTVAFKEKLNEKMELVNCSLF